MAAVPRLGADERGHGRGGVSRVQMKYRPFIIVIVLLALAVLALQYTVDVRVADQAGIRMALPTRLGDWRGSELRFCHNEACLKEFPREELKDAGKCPACGTELFTMTLIEYKSLPTDTEFLKGKYTNAAGESVFVSIVLSGRERESIHRPERCLVGQGNSIDKSYVLEAPLAGQKPLGVMTLETSRPVDLRSGKQTLSGYYAYWFVGQGRETPSHGTRMFWLAWDRIVHSVAHRWAYIAIAGRREAGSDKFQQQVKDFAGLLQPEIKLAAPARPATPGGS